MRLPIDPLIRNTDGKIGARPNNLAGCLSPCCPRTLRCNRATVSYSLSLPNRTRARYSYRRPKSTGAMSKDCTSRDTYQVASE
jgi:hypothetical protein